jgi:hypothetical protein
MSIELTTILIMAGVSAVLQAMGYFVPSLRKAAGVLLLVWMAAALPILFFRNIPAEGVLLFYILSALCGLIFSFGGKKA